MFFPDIMRTTYDIGTISLDTRKTIIIELWFDELQ